MFCFVFFFTCLEKSPLQAMSMLQLNSMLIVKYM